MRSAAAIARDVDRGAEIIVQRKALDAELKELEARLETDALARPDEHEPLADADREGKQFLAAGTGITLPIVFTADKLVKTFAPKSDVHERIEAASDGQLLRFYRLKPVYECTQKDGKAMRAFELAERLHLPVLTLVDTPQGFQLARFPTTCCGDNSRMTRLWHCSAKVPF